MAQNMVNLIISCVFEKKKVYSTACVCECVCVWRKVFFKCQLDWLGLYYSGHKLAYSKFNFYLGYWEESWNLQLKLYICLFLLNSVSFCSSFGTYLFIIDKPSWRINYFVLWNILYFWCCFLFWSLI